MTTKRIEISSKTILFISLFLIALNLLWQIRGILSLLFFCFIFMEILHPSVLWLEKHKISRPIAVFILYLLIIVSLSFVFASLIPILIEQTTGLITTLPKLLQNTQFFGVSAIDWSSQFSFIGNLPQNITKAVFSVFSNVFMTFVFFIITFYLLIERKNFPRYSRSLFGQKGAVKANTIIANLEKRLGSWFNAEIVLMTLIGLISYFGYLLLGLNYALPLALIAGLLEIVPNIGPTVSTVLAAVVALTISPLTALLTVAWGIFVQQLENNLIVPKIMKHTVGLNPLVTIFFLLVGAKLAGVAGAILAIPVFLTIDAVLRVLLPQRFFYNKNPYKPVS